MVNKTPQDCEKFVHEHEHYGMAMRNSSDSIIAETKAKVEHRDVVAIGPVPDRDEDAVPAGQKRARAMVCHLAFRQRIPLKQLSRQIPKIEKRLKEKTGNAPLYYHYLSAFASSFDMWDSVQTISLPRGHGLLQAYMGLRPTDPDTLEYEALMRDAFGQAYDDYASRTGRVLPL